MMIKAIDIGMSIPGTVRDNAGQARNAREKGGETVQNPPVEAAPAKATEEAPKAEAQAQQRRAYFALDDNKNVVIRIVDEEGNVIRQIPPEEFLKTVDTLKENMQNLLHLEA